jgi:hypothetical protein
VGGFQNPVPIVGDTFKIVCFNPVEADLVQDLLGACISAICQGKDFICAASFSPLSREAMADSVAKPWAQNTLPDADA